MPENTTKITAGSQFTGLADAGLFESRHPGAPHIHARINALTFHTTSSCAWVLSLVDPLDSDNAPVLLADSSADMTLADYLIPNDTSDPSSPATWALKFETTGMTGDGWLSINWDYQRTES